MLRRWPIPRLAFTRPSERGDSERPFDRLVLPHLEAAWNYALYLTRDTAVAEDVVQEAFMRALRAQHACRGDGKAWLLTIVRNCWHDWLKANRAAAAAPLDEAANEETPHSLLERQQEVSSLRSVIERMPEPFRETLVLRELEELSYREIAEATGAPIGTVMSRLARGREMLAALILDGGNIDQKGAMNA